VVNKFSAFYETRGSLSLSLTSQSKCLTLKRQDNVLEGISSGMNSFFSILYTLTDIK